MNPAVLARKSLTLCRLTNSSFEWMGQNTEDIFYDLADEYGMLVWNDFWLSTQNWNLEPDDARLSSTTRRKSSPAIATIRLLPCGAAATRASLRPPLTRGSPKLITGLDGTRYYSANSDKINLYDSGPYKYQEPADYFTTLSFGFAVEVGLPSPPTLEAITQPGIPE